MVPIETLRQFTFFRGFSDAQLEKLAALATEESHMAGTQIYRQGDPAKSLYIVNEGKIVMVMDSYMGPHKPPMQVTVDIITKGDEMGWSAVVEPYVFTLGALCIENAKILAFDAAKLRDLMEVDHDIGYRVMQVVARLIANRLNHTRIILVGERGLSVLTEY